MLSLLSSIYHILPFGYVAVNFHIQNVGVNGEHLLVLDQSAILIPIKDADINTRLLPEVAFPYQD